jgi:hypothetical protein
MPRSVIYFPYIRVPQNQWFTQVLLYWDQVISIVPEEVQGSFELGPSMDRLMDLNLVKPLSPRRYIERIPHFDEAFIDYVNSPAYPIRGNSRELRHMQSVDVHLEKLAPGLLENLRRKGLVRREHGSWIEMEAYTANQYMAYLASCLGRLPEINSTPITDNDFNFQSIDPEYFRVQAEINAMRGIVLNDIFPSPERVIAPEDIIDFKRDHHNELNSFRNRIEHFLIETAAIRDDTIRSLMVDQFKMENQDVLRALEEGMQSRRWGNITWGRFLAYAPGLVALLGFPNPLAIAGGILGLASAVCRDYTNRRGDDLRRENPMAYAMMAGRLGGRR